ncbi:MAG: BrnT family toxin [Proteobacteria bacterium]|nr:BrnT family toxin [Pseudomonadota bacterium]MCH8220108.1 BrnT family toxin [Pseudomonadota bacterium]
MHTVNSVEYEWDLVKTKANAIKHGVGFADAVIALEDELALTIADLDSEDETRFVSLGMDAMGRVLVTVFTHRDDVVRIISSRKASKGEGKCYGAI